MPTLHCYSETDKRRQISTCNPHGDVVSVRGSYMLDGWMGGVWLAGHYWAQYQSYCGLLLLLTGAAVVKRVAQKPRQCSIADTQLHVFLSLSYTLLSTMSSLYWVKISRNIQYWIQYAWVEFISDPYCLLFLSNTNLEEVGLKTDTSTNMVFFVVDKVSAGQIPESNAKISSNVPLNLLWIPNLVVFLCQIDLCAVSMEKGHGTEEDTSGQIYLFKKGGLYNGRAVTWKVTPHNRSRAIWWRLLATRLAVCYSHCHN